MGIVHVEFAFADQTITNLGGRNASLTQPAKFMVLLLKNKGESVLVPEK